MTDRIETFTGIFIRSMAPFKIVHIMKSHSSGHPGIPPIKYQPTHLELDGGQIIFS